MCGVGALATYPVEAMSLALLEDDRLARNFDSVCDTLRQELDFLESLPHFIFRRLCVVINAKSPVQLRHEILQATYTSVCYYSFRTLDVAGGVALVFRQG